MESESVRDQALNVPALFHSLRNRISDQLAVLAGANAAGRKISSRTEGTTRRGSCQAETFGCTAAINLDSRCFRRRSAGYQRTCKCSAKAIPRTRHLRFDDDTDRSNPRARKVRF